jgi:hypothetical protein
MTRVVAAVLALAAFALSGCGTSLCVRATEQRDRIFSGKTKCEYTEGSSTISVSASNSSTSACESNLSKCSSADQSLLNDWLKCLEGVPACTTGNEKAAVQGTMACAATLFDTATGTPKVSMACFEAIR